MPSVSLLHKMWLPMVVTYCIKIKSNYSGTKLACCYIWGLKITVLVAHREIQKLFAKVH